MNYLTYRLVLGAGSSIWGLFAALLLLCVLVSAAAVAIVFAVAAAVVVLGLRAVDRAQRPREERERADRAYADSPQGRYAFDGFLAYRASLPRDQQAALDQAYAQDRARHGTQVALQRVLQPVA